MDQLSTMDDPVIPIGVLAERVGLSVSAVRKYENEGLVIAHRSKSGRRFFSREDIGRVRNVQHMIQGLGLNIEGIHRMQALLPCWDLVGCEPEVRKSCPAYQHSARPCWMIKGLGCTPQGNECRQCVVYRFGSLCTQDIKRVLHDQNDFPNPSAAVEELLGRLREVRRENDPTKVDKGPIDEPMSQGDQNQPTGHSPTQQRQQDSAILKEDSDHVG